MAFTFTPIKRDVYEKTVATQSHRASEPRDTIYNDLVLLFLEAGHEIGAAGIDEDSGHVLGFTWADVPESVQDMIASKEKDQSIDTIRATVNQTQNRDRWHVFCKVVKNPDNALGFIFVNEKMESDRKKADAQAKADAKAAEQTAA